MKELKGKRDGKREWRETGRCFCTTYRATLKNSEASKYHKHDPCCGQLYVRVLCPRVSNQISTAGWYSTSLPLGDLEWEKTEERGKKRFNHNKQRKTLTISDMAYHRASSYLLQATQGRGEKENERDSLMLSLTWNRLISRGFPAVFKQF